MSLQGVVGGVTGIVTKPVEGKYSSASHIIPLISAFQVNVFIEHMSKIQMLC